MPVYAIEARGVDNSSEADSDIDEMIEHYLDRIATVQREGPYFFLGHSFGGMAAFEMAQRLIAANEKVACLIVLDTLPPRDIGRFPFGERTFGRACMAISGEYCRNRSEQI